MNIHTALDLAILAHKGQFRHDGTTPYIVRPIQVFLKLKSWGIQDQSILQAALLHDAVEDGGVTLDEVRKTVGDKVANIVHELTIYPGEDKQTYLNSFPNKSCEAIVVKIADRVCNVKDFWANGKRTYAKQYLRKADAVIKAFNDMNNDIEAVIGMDSYHKMSQYLMEYLAIPAWLLYSLITLHTQRLRLRGETMMNARSLQFPCFSSGR